MTKPKLKNNETDSYPLRKRAWVVQIEKCLRAEQNNYSEDVNIISLLDCSNIPEKTNKDGSRIEIINNIQTWSNWKSIFKKKHLNKEIIPYPSSERLNNYFGNETLFWIQSYSKHLELITGNNFYNFDSKKHEHPVIKNRFYNLFSAIDLYDIQNFYTEIVSAKVSQEILISINENWAPRVYKKDSPGLTLLMPDIHKKTTTGFKINEKYEKFQQNKFNLDRPLNMPGPPISEQTSKLHDCFDYYKIPIYLLALYNEDSVKQNDALKKQLSIDFLTTCICINYIDSSNSLNQKLYSEVLKLTRELQQSLLFPISRNKHIFNFIKSIVFDIFSDFGMVIPPLLTLFKTRT